MIANEVALHNDLAYFNSLSAEQKLEKYLQLKEQEIHYQENVNCWELRYEKPVNPFLEKDLGKKFLLNEEKNKIRGDRLKMGGMFGSAACTVVGLGGSILFPAAAPAFVFGVMGAGYGCLATSGIGKAMENFANDKLNGFDNAKRQELIQREINKENRNLEQQRIYNRSFEKEILLEIEKGNLKTKNINSIDDLNQIVKEKEIILTQKSREIVAKHFSRDHNPTLNTTPTQEIKTTQTPTIEPTLEIKPNQKSIEPNQVKDEAVSKSMPISNKEMVQSKQIQQDISQINLNTTPTQEIKTTQTPTIEPTLEIKPNQKSIETNQAKEQEQPTQIKDETSPNFTPKEIDTMKINKPQPLAFSSDDLDMIDSIIDDELAFQDFSNLEPMEVDINEFNLEVKSQYSNQDFLNELGQVENIEPTQHKQNIDNQSEVANQSQDLKAENIQEFKNESEQIKNAEPIQQEQQDKNAEPIKHEQEAQISPEITHQEQAAQDFTAKDLGDMSYAFAISKFSLDKSAVNFKEVELISSALKNSIGDEYLSVSKGGTTAFQSLMSLDDAIRQSNEKNGTFATHKVSFSIKADGKEYKNFNVFLGDNPSAFGKDFDYLVAIGQPEIIENRSKVNKMFDFIKDKTADGKYKNILENGSRFAKNTLKELAEQMQQLSAFSPEAQALIAGFVKSYFIENSNNKINYKPKDKESSLIDQVNDMAKQQSLIKDEKSQVGDIDIRKLAANIKIDKANNARHRVLTNQPTSRAL